LYSITGNLEYLRLADFFYHSDVIDPLIVETQCETSLPGNHANTFIPKIVAEARMNKNNLSETIEKTKGNNL